MKMALARISNTRTVQLDRMPRVKEGVEIWWRAKTDIFLPINRSLGLRDPKRKCGTSLSTRRRTKRKNCHWLEYLTSLLTNSLELYLGNTCVAIWPRAKKWHPPKPRKHSLGFQDRKRVCGTSVSAQKGAKRRKGHWREPSTNLLTNSSEFYGYNPGVVISWKVKTGIFQNPLSID